METQSVEKDCAPKEKAWRRLIKQMPLPRSFLGASILLFTLCFLAVLVTGFGAILYGWTFTNFMGADHELEDWANFAIFMSLFVQTLIGSATIGVAILISGGLAAQLEERRTLDNTTREKVRLADLKERERASLEERRSRELVRLSEKMVDTKFYIKVMYPAWEVALKWMDDTLPDGDRFRAEVVGAELRLPKNYSNKSGEQDLAEGLVRYHPHFLPYDVPADDHSRSTPIIEELSESLAFATWVRFWRNVKFLIDRGIVDATDARHLFREWYMWWAPFMTEFVAVCLEVMNRLEATYGYVPDSESWSQSSIVKLQELHSDFHIPRYCGRVDRREFETHIDFLVKGIIPHFYEAIDDAKNEHIDGRFDPTRIVTPRMPAACQEATE